VGGGGGTNSVEWEEEEEDAVGGWGGGSEVGSVPGGRGRSRVVRMASCANIGGSPEGLRTILGGGGGVG
jgi:hypothetical protein